MAEIPQAEAAAVSVSESTTEQTDFSLWQRLAIWFISTIGTLVIRLIGPTIRFKVEIEECGPPEILRVPAVYCFWHQCVFASAWFFRNRDIAVMTSRSFDGEYIARIIENFGFRAVRGSSSRGGVRALLGMHTEIEQGRVAAFTIDGPRGPKHVAKPGPVLLARNTQMPIVCYHLSLERKWILKSWDATMIPKPFTRAVLRVSKLIPVPRDLDSAGIEKLHTEMQATLDRVADYAERAIKPSN